MLQEIGDWLRVNGEGIYGSKSWVKFGEGDDANGKIKSLPTGMLGRKQADFKFGADDFRFTVGKDGSLFAYCLTVPAGGSHIKIKSLGTAAQLFPKGIQSVSLLGTSPKLAWKQEADGLEIALPEKFPAKYVVGFKIN